MAEAPGGAPGGRAHGNAHGNAHGEDVDDVVELSREEWLEALEDIGEARGYFEPLGPDHSVIFTDRGTTLLVTFETIDEIMEAGEDGLPFGFRLSDEYGWSQLCLLGHEDGWFRGRPLWMYFDRLVDDGFFDEFDRVVFYGAGPCGYAACAYSVAAPGATVLAIQPRATLDGDIVTWDMRHVDARRAFTSSRYSFAPDMLDAAERAFVLYDPAQAYDAMHASMFAKPHVERIKMRHLGGKIELQLHRMGILVPLIRDAMEGRLDRRALLARWREGRRGHLALLRAYLGELTAGKRHRLTVLLARHVLRLYEAPRFRRAGDHASAALKEQGVEMPLARAGAAADGATA